MIASVISDAAHWQVGQGCSLSREGRNMNTEQATGCRPIAHGRLITLSQWDGSAFLSPGLSSLPAAESEDGTTVTERPGSEGTAPATA